MKDEVAVLNDGRFLRNVLLKAAGLFIVFNLLYMAFNPLPALGRISAYNVLLPGRLRFPFGENPQRSYNISLYSVDAMFASHEINGARKTADEYRVLVVGDSSVWGTLLRPQETLSGQLNAAGLRCGGKTVRTFNLGYPTISLLKDVMVMDEARRYQPDLVIWAVTLEAFPSDKQLFSPILANNLERLEPLLARYDLEIDLSDLEVEDVTPGLLDNDFYYRTLFSQRRGLADLLRLQLYGVLWAATGIDQEYPAEYNPAQRDLDADTSFHQWKQETTFGEGDLDWNVLAAGMQAAGTPVLLVNEPILIARGNNSDIRYDFFYPRWAYDQYRQQLRALSAAQSWDLLDAWDLVPQEQFTNSAIHLTPQGESLLAKAVGERLEGICGK
jgi:hypothetical protein